MVQRVFSSFLLRKNPSLNAAISLFSDAVVIAVENEADVIVDSVPITSTSEWPSVIERLIAKHQLTGSQLAVVLGQGLYQSLLIDKPELSGDELTLALPYLVKDLVNEAPEDIVADGFSSLHNDRLQVFVSTRQQLNKIVSACQTGGCTVGCMTVESVVWSEFTVENRSQLVVHRYGNGNLQLTAFSQNKLFFQRQLRGFDVPLVSEPSSDIQALQLDSLALELQRSLDFLSAQLRDDPISQLLISCDNDNNQQLALALNERLTVMVQAVEPSLSLLTSTGTRVAWAGLKQGFSSAINLYSQHLQPKRQWLSLNNMVASWLVLVVLIGVISGVYSFKSRQLVPQLVTNKAQLTTAQSQLTLTQKQLLLHIVSPIKQQRISVLEQEVIAKQSTLEAVATHDASLMVGYGQVLTQLATAASNNIAIERILISGNAMDLNGVARSPDAVPRWLGTFNRYSTLADRRFQLLDIGRNDSNQITFILQAQRIQEAN
ncbi:MSHA biogenesis protein MshI [Photobacterium phosphoreum]|uniref:MSHA biogenesis protein MshI n=1 Tax=Photobacterium phosphoreum TaxID=659 RepID=UPI000D164FC5|nr:MSHA biogenesis protein MshI [Photobacterium phosphoreum]PSU64388.1 MSHA biogenesis protein MshI [Photobacterium phosphoreum]